MPRPRKACVCLDATPYYHCSSRCVRRAFLCGVDINTGQSFEHRREWIESHLVKLAQVFCIGICSYAIMSNHYHVVLKVNNDKAKNLNDHQVLSRWCELFSAKPLVLEYLRNPSSLLEAQQDVVKTCIATYRERLSNLSWFMRCLNEPIARRANKEDNCTGHFWESRFDSQAILDEAALLSIMAYVDLNPVRAKMAATPEQSDFTSIKARLFEPKIEQHLLPFTPTQKLKQIIEGIPFDFKDYLELIDWTGRVIRAGKRGSIAGNTPPILERLNIDSAQWIKQHHQLETHYPNFLGQWKSIQQACEQFKRKWIKGKKYSRLLFSG